MNDKDAETAELYLKVNEGLAAYAADDPYRAHEVWEELWSNETGRTKNTLQILIQIAVAVHKHQVSVPAGTAKLLAKAKERLHEMSPGSQSWLGIDLTGLALEIERALAQADAVVQDPSATFTPPRLPERVGRDGILYLHGFASGPTSTKAHHIERAFRARGIHVSVPDLNEDDFEHFSISRALTLARRSIRDRTVIVGSSLGGYIGTLLAERDDRIRGLILLAPAFEIRARFEELLGREGIETWRQNGGWKFDHHAYKEQRLLSYTFMEDAAKYSTRPVVRVPARIIHGAKDEVIPLASVEDFVRSSSQKDLRLEIVDDDHSLAGSLDRIERTTLDLVEALRLAPDGCLKPNACLEPEPTG